MTLRVIVQIVPAGDEVHAREIGRMNISNITIPRDENENGEVSDYVVRGHRRKAGFWELIRKALNAAADGSAAHD